jgi:hypothetical protein
MHSPESPHTIGIGHPTSYISHSISPHICDTDSLLLIYLCKLNTAKSVWCPQLLEELFPFRPTTSYRRLCRSHLNWYCAVSVTMPENFHFREPLPSNDCMHFCLSCCLCNFKFRNESNMRKLALYTVPALGNFHAVNGLCRCIPGKRCAAY